MNIYRDIPHYRRLASESAVAAKAYAEHRVQEILEVQPELTGKELHVALEQDLRTAREEFDARDDAND